MPNYIHPPLGYMYSLWNASLSFRLYVSEFYMLFARWHHSEMNVLVFNWLLNIKPKIYYCFWSVYQHSG